MLNNLTDKQKLEIAAGLCTLYTIDRILELDPYNLLFLDKTLSLFMI